MSDRSEPVRREASFPWQRSCFHLCSESAFPNEWDLKSTEQDRGRLTKGSGDAHRAPRSVQSQSLPQARRQEIDRKLHQESILRSIAPRALSSTETRDADWLPPKRLPTESYDR